MNYLRQVCVFIGRHSAVTAGAVLTTARSGMGAIGAAIGSFLNSQMSQARTALMRMASATTQTPFEASDDALEDLSRLLQYDHSSLLNVLYPSSSALLTDSVGTRPGTPDGETTCVSPYSSSQLCAVSPRGRGPVSVDSFVMAPDRINQPPAQASSAEETLQTIVKDNQSLRSAVTITRSSLAFYYVTTEQPCRCANG